MILHIGGKVATLGLVLAALITAFSAPRSEPVVEVPLEFTPIAVVSSSAREVPKLQAAVQGPVANPRYVLRATGYNSLESQTDSTPFITATGTRTRFGVVAVSRDLLGADLPYGSLVRIRDLGAYHTGNGVGAFQSMLDSQQLFVVEDTMHARKNQQIDVWFERRSFVPFMAWRHIRRRGLQSGITVLGVAVGVMVLIVALSLTNGFIDELISSTLRATPMLTLQSYVNGEVLPDDRQLLADLAQQPEVVAAAPFLTGQALIARRASAALGIPGRQGYTQVLGIDPDLHKAVLDLQVIELQAEAMKREGGIVLGASLAQQLGVLRGDSVMLRDINGATAEFEVVGTFRVGNELIDAVTSYMWLGNLQSYLRQEDAITGYHLRLDEPTRAHTVGVSLADRYSLRPVSWEGMFGSLVSQLRLQKAVISVVVFLIVLVAALGITNILVLTVAEKTEEIAIIRDLGATEKQVLSIFTLEGFLLGGGGTLLGALLGLLVSAYFRVQPFPLPGDLYFITQLPVEVQAFDVLWVCGVSLATSVIAGLVPARRAARLDPVAVLR